MLLSDRLNMRQRLEVLLKDEHGNILQHEVCGDDIVTTVGLERAASHLASASPVIEWFTNLAFGSNDDAASSEDWTLGAEFYREALDSIYASGNVVYGTLTIQGLDIGAVVYTIRELGLLDAASGGNLICRQVLDTVVSLTGTNQVFVIWAVEVT